MIIVGSTLAAFCTDQDDTSLAWLYNAEEMRDSHPDGVEFFAALEVDGRGLEPFAKVIRRLAELDGTYYTYRYDDGRTTIETGSRLNHICMGRNIVHERAMDRNATHILFLDADMRPPGDAIPRLLELNWPMVGGEVGTYGLTGPPVKDPIYPAFWDVQQHMNTAGFLLMERQCFKRLGWRWSLEDGMTDDPCMAQDAEEFLGFPTYVRHDVKGQHMPHMILPIERRFPERDMKVYQ